MWLRIHWKSIYFMFDLDCISPPKAVSPYIAYVKRKSILPTWLRKPTKNKRLPEERSIKASNEIAAKDITTLFIKSRGKWKLTLGLFRLSNEWVVIASPRVHINCTDLVAVRFYSIPPPNSNPWQDWGVV